MTTSEKTQTTSKRIRTVYFWTKKQIDEAKEEAERLYNYFRSKTDEQN